LQTELRIKEGKMSEKEWMSTIDSKLNRWRRKHIKHLMESRLIKMNEWSILIIIYYP
jgi:hypothetical protein